MAHDLDPAASLNLTTFFHTDRHDYWNTPFGSSLAHGSPLTDDHSFWQLPQSDDASLSARHRGHLHEKKHGIVKIDGSVDRITGAAFHKIRTSNHDSKRLQIFNGFESVDVGLDDPVEDLAELTIPVNKRGKLLKGDLPVVVLLHGQHEPVYESDMPDALKLEPRPAWATDFAFQGNALVPSYQGYRYVADSLARDGRIVLSISANGINAQADAHHFEEMNARGQLVEHHLQALKDGSTGTAYDQQLKKRANLSNVVLMGHSRGGEGVVYAAQQINGLNNPSFAIGGVMNFAPVNNSFDALGTIPMVNLLPSCDGDVVSLQGQSYVERARDLYKSRPALQSSIWLEGGNHNYLNTQWTPGLAADASGGQDDSLYVYKDENPPEDNGHCTQENRLSAEQERIAGQTYLVQFARMVQDNNISGLKLFDGSTYVPSVFRANKINAKTSSIGGSDKSILAPSPTLQLRSRGLKAEVYESSFSSLSNTAPLLSLESEWQGEWTKKYPGARRITPLTAWQHAPFEGLPRDTLEMSWSSSGMLWVNKGSLVDLSKADQLVSRVVLDPSLPGQLNLALRDVYGHTALLPVSSKLDNNLTSSALDLRLWPQMLHASLPSDSELDLSRIKDIGFKAKGQGRAWILDVAKRSNRIGFKGSSPKQLPSASVEQVTFPLMPGDQTVEIPVVTDMPVTSDTRIFYKIDSGVNVNQDVLGEIPRSLQGQVTIKKGESSVNVEVPVSWKEVSAPVNGKISIYTQNGAGLAGGGSNFTLVPANGDYPIVSIDNPISWALPGGTWVWNVTPSNVFSPEVLRASFLFRGQAIPINVVPLSDGSFNLVVILPDDLRSGDYFEADLLLSGAVLKSPVQLVGYVD